MFDTSAFIYTGANATQTGVAPGTIEPARTAVLRGTVVDRSGGPVGAVTVKVLGRPEFGQTTTDSAGAYTLVVNGGERFTLTLDKPGFVPLQRPVEPDWQRWERLDEVVLTARQATATQASFTADAGGEPIVARGAPESDGDGARQGTLLIPDDTTAQMKMPDGSTQPLSGGDLRITELTVGDTGPEAMTAPLPAESGYTYAVELSVDQAEAAGASELTFSEPLPYYTENFIDFPVGTVVPLGSYDEQRGAWVPADSGRVVKIVSESGGEAQLDTDGDGAGDVTGFDPAELAQLAALYEPGQELWRVELPHFSTWDLNWGIRPPDSARPPSGNPAPPPGDGRGRPDEGFGRIDPEDQVLIEDIGLTGVDFGLHHSTRRSEGYDPARTVEVRIDDPLPGPVKRIEIDVSVAGRELARTLYAPGTAPPGGQEFSPGQVVEVEWDGRDTFGRALAGGQEARVRVGHTYAAEYGTTSRFGYSQGPAITGSPTREDLTLWTERTESLGAIEPAAAALGGFSPSVHHTYDPVGEVLYEGDGGVRATRGAAPVIETIAEEGPGNFSYSMNVAPDGSMTWDSGGSGGSRLVRRAPDGTVATLRQGSAPGNPDGLWLRGNSEQAEDLPVQDVFAPGGLNDFERAPDGSFLYIDRGCRTRRIYRDPQDVWRVRTIAGRATPPQRCDRRPAGDGGPAVDAGFGSFTSAVAGHPDGGAVIGDYQTVRRVFPDGRIATIGVAEVPSIGGGSEIASNINDLSIDREGRVLWRTECFVGRIELDGSSTRLAGHDGIGPVQPFEEGMTAFSTFACGGSFGSTAADYGDATYGSVETGPDGAIYYNGGTGAQGKRVLRLGADGRVTTYAGGPSTSRANTGDGGPARQARITDVGGLGFDGQGRLVIATGTASRIRRVDAPLPGFQRTDSTHRIPSEDGREVYVFGATGRHLRTRDALTGATLWEFAYDSEGRLVSVDDVDGDATAIERDASGVATAIVGPDGDRTTLAHDASQRLTSVTNPASEATGFEWATGDLMAAVTGARGNRFAFTYDSDGRITRAEDPPDPNGPEGFRTYSRTTNATTTTVTATSALGRETVHRLIRPPSTARRRVITRPGGEVTIEERATDESTTATTADGTSVRSTEGPDPRYGMLAPVEVRREVDPPGSAPTATRLGRRTVAGLDPLDPFSFTSVTEAWSETAGTDATGDDRTTSLTYTRADKKLELQAAQSPSRSFTITLDENGRQTRIERPGEDPVEMPYRADGRPASRSQGARTLAFAYDNQGRPSSITDPTGAVAGLQQDDARRLRSIIQPSSVGGATTLERDPDGQVNRVTTPLGTEHAFGFRPTDELFRATPPSVGSDPASEVTTYSHDAARALIGTDAPGASDVVIARSPASGRVSSVTASGAGTIDVSYDAGGQVTGLATPDATLGLGYDGLLPTSDSWSGGIAGSVSRTYDADHRLASRSVAGDGAASTIDFAYDADTLLTGVSGAMEATVDRDPATGRPEALVSGYTREEWGYSPGFAELSRQTVTHSGNALYDAQFSRDSFGRVAQKTETFGGDPPVVSSYAYDAGGRLTSATIGGTTTSYTWDRNGNRTSDGAGYDAQDRLTGTATATFTHTPDGQRRTRTEGSQTTTYTYDALGNLRAVDLPGTGDDIAYGIDGLGRRVERRVGGTVTHRWIYDRAGRIVAELDGGNDLVASYAYLPDQNTPFLMRRGATTYRLVVDKVGSVRLVVDTSDGSVAQRINYDPFGVSIFSGPQSAGFIPFGFAGGHYDSATGLVRMGARDYDPSTGRFTAKDPIGFAGGLVSLYAYVGGDPVNRNDPSGLGPNDRFVTIYRYHGHPVPHLAIGIGRDLPTGLYPSSALAPHSLGELNTDGPNADEILRVKVTPRQEQKIRDYIETKKRTPPIYNMFSVGDSDTNNCATFVGEALEDSGLYQNTQAGYLPTNGWGQSPTAMTPGGVFDSIRAANPGSMYLNRD